MPTFKHLKDKNTSLLLLVCWPKFHNAVTKGQLIQRVLNRWSKLSEQKLRFFSKVKIKKNAFDKNDGHIGFI